MDINGKFCINNHLNYFFVREENAIKTYRKGYSDAVGLGKCRKEKINLKNQPTIWVRKASKILFCQCNLSPVLYLRDSSQYVLSLFQGYGD